MCICIPRGDSNNKRWISQASREARHFWRSPALVVYLEGCVLDPPRGPCKFDTRRGRDSLGCVIANLSILYRARWPLALLTRCESAEWQLCRVRLTPLSPRPESRPRRRIVAGRSWAIPGQATRSRVERHQKHSLTESPGLGLPRPTGAGPVIPQRTWGEGGIGLCQCMSSRNCSSARSAYCPHSLRRTMIVEEAGISGLCSMLVWYARVQRQRQRVA